MGVEENVAILKSVSLLYLGKVFGLSILTWADKKKQGQDSVQDVVQKG